MHHDKMTIFHAQVFAVDPGLNGAWACLDFNGRYMKSGEIPRFSKLINGTEFAGLIRLFRPKQIVIEQVHSMPRQGVASSFTFGTAYGMVLGIACGAEIPLHLVTPARWKMHFKLSRKAKDAARERAIQLFPDAAGDLKLKKDHGKADALLLARYFLDRQREGKFT